MLLTDAAARAAGADTVDLGEHRLKDLESARLQAEAIGNRVVQAFAQAQLGWIAIVRGEYEGAERICAEALETARASGDDWIIFGVLGNYAGAVIELGDVARGRRLLEEALAAVRRVGDVRNISNTLTNLGWATLVDGDPEAALPLLEEGLHLTTELGDVVQLPSVLHLLGMQANDVGDHARAEEVLREGLATGEGLGERHQVAETLAELARALVARAPDEAAEALAAAQVTPAA